MPYTEIGYFEAFLKALGIVSQQAGASVARVRKCRQVWNQVREHAAQPE